MDAATLSAVVALVGSQFFVILARLSFVVFLFPGLGEQMIPVQVRALILISLSAAFTSLGLVEPVPMTPITGFVGVMLGEVLIGFCLGVTLRLLIWILSVAGTIIAQSVGLAQFLGVGLETEAQTLTANLLGLAGAALLLTVNYHVSAFQGFVLLYGEVPVGGYQILEPFAVMEKIFAGFNFAVSLAWPFVMIGLIYNICLGFMNKAMPQLMVAFVGAPFMVGAGLFIMAISIVSMLYAWKDRLPDFVPWM